MKLEDTIGYHFQNQRYLTTALTHSSYSHEHHQSKQTCNERLEFLGDAVLEVISSEFLYHRFPEEPEGVLTKKRASMVCEPSLALCAKDIGLSDYLILGKGEAQTGGGNRSSILSDALEALIGAIYLDGGFSSAKDFVLSFILNDLDEKELFYDSKTILQEKVQADSMGELQYKLLEAIGPDHNKTFLVQVEIGGKKYATGKGQTKKAAQQQAAYQTLLQLKKETLS